MRALPRAPDPVARVASVTRYAESSLPTEWGTFQVAVFRTPEGAEHLAIVRGVPAGVEGLLVRVHSECFTGEVLQSLKCDCREQLSTALARIAEAGAGVVVYLRQEGRGIGLGNKIRAYALQDRGLDTVDANRMLGFPDDPRTYEEAVAILRALGVASIRLITNNPAKVEALRAGGLDVVGRIPSIAAAGEHNRSYLDTKRRRMGHIIDPAPVESDETTPRTARR